MYLNKRNRLFTEGKSSPKTSGFRGAERTSRDLNWPSRAPLAGLLAFGLFGAAPLGWAQGASALKGISCSAVAMVSPGTVSCSVNLTGPAPVGGATVQLTSSSSALGVPASVVVPAGQSSAIFSAAASTISAAESATVTAATGGAQQGTAVSLLSSTSPVQVVAKNSGKCLDVRAFSTSEGANVQQWSCGGTPNQQWLFIATGDGSYEVQSVNSSLSLNIDGNSSSDGAPVVQWRYSGAANEKWALQPTGNGYYNVVAESTGKCLDVTGGPAATGDGILVQQWVCWGGDNQAWQLVSQHSVSLSWDASTSKGVTGYYVYRGTTSGGPYNKMSSLLGDTNYLDGAVQAGQTYYYVTTAADSSGAESGYSNQVQATVPTS